MKGAVPHSLVWATDIDVLPLDKELERRERVAGVCLRPEVRVRQSQAASPSPPNSGDG